MELNPLMCGMCVCVYAKVCCYRVMKLIKPNNNFIRSGMQKHTISRMRNKNRRFDENERKKERKLDE